MKLTVTRAHSPEEQLEAQHLVKRVYAREFGIDLNQLAQVRPLAFPADVLLVRNEKGMLVGTASMLTPLDNLFASEYLFGFGIRKEGSMLPLGQAVEVGRLAKEEGEESGLIAKAIMLATVAYLKENNLKGWIATVKPGMKRMLAKTGLDMLFFAPPSAQPDEQTQSSVLDGYKKGSISCFWAPAGSTCEAFQALNYLIDNGTVQIDLQKKSKKRQSVDDTPVFPLDQEENKLLKIMKTLTTPLFARISGLLSLIAVLVCLQAFSARAHDRTPIRQAIANQNQCKSLAFTNTGAVALYGRNGYFLSGYIPSQMQERLRSLRAEGKEINDVVLTENGKWIILWEHNGLSWGNIPYSLEQALRNYNDKGEQIMSVALNDNNEWVIVTDKHYRCSDSRITQYLGAGEKEYGELWTVHITNQSMVVVYARGYKYAGSVPDQLKQSLRSCQKDIFRIKFLEDGSYLMADKDGWYRYYL